ncbi:MAG: hypothetical protein FWB72_03820 [Firmicutes bacterium]|nr:hypothetical protein [Bacillota bacterium]
MVLAKFSKRMLILATGLVLAACGILGAIAMLNPDNIRARAEVAIHQTQDSTEATQNN